MVVGLFTASAQSPRSEEQKIAAILDAWHKAATHKPKFAAYFGLMTSDAIFIGTDAKEKLEQTAKALLQSLISIEEKPGILQL